MIDRASGAARAEAGGARKTDGNLPTAAREDSHERERGNRTDYQRDRPARADSWSTATKQCLIRESTAIGQTGRKAGPPIRSNSDYPTNGDKRVPDLETALRLCGLRDGMTISSHHHLRNGDRVALTALQTAARMGAKDLVWFPSASFPCHEPVIELMKSGAVHHIEGSMNGPLGDYCSHGHMRGLGVLRSHGGRWQAVQDGEVHIDIAVIAAPTADLFRQR